MTVAGGTPTLTLNDGGTATYTGGSGTSALTFSYTVAPDRTPPTCRDRGQSQLGDHHRRRRQCRQSVAPGLTQSGPQIDTTAPTVSSVTATSRGDFDAGKTVTLTLNLSEAVTVAGTPTLTLNDGGTATYISGSGTSALTFSYTVAAGQNTAALAVTAVNLNPAPSPTAPAMPPITAGLPETSDRHRQIDTTTPTISVVAESPSSGDLNAGKTVTLTLTMSEAVTVARAARRR